MHDAAQYLRKIQPWYQQVVRRFLLKRQLTEKVASLDADITFLDKQAGTVANPTPVCFLGSSGVGKSTLINAIVAGSTFVVPSGGIGPLTARELKIEFGEEPLLSVAYHQPKQIWRLLFALAKMFPKELQTSEKELEETSQRLTEDDQFDLDSSSASESTQGMTRAEAYRKLAVLIVTGKQDSDVPLPYAWDCLREAMGRPRNFGTERRECDKARVQRLRSIFAAQSNEVARKSSYRASDVGFQDVVADHATGFLAPLVSEFRIKWNSELLKRGVEVVDLPGLGIAGDVYRQVTNHWIGKKAEIVVLVVNSRGITQADSELLKSSGFLTRLLHSADDPKADPVSLVIAVVQIDSIAEDRKYQDQDKTKKKLDHFRIVQQEAHELLKGQIRERLRDAWMEGGASESSTAKLEIISRLADTTPIFPLSALQYRQFLDPDDDSNPFVRSQEDSGVPQFMAGLVETASKLQKGRQARFHDRLELFDAELRSQLRVIHARLGEAEATSEQAAKLKENLDSFLPPLREELRARQGQFRSYLKETLPARIETLVSDARIAASKDLKVYLRKLKDAHWATLRAAVRRGGTFHGSRNVEIPRDFAQALEEPIAEIWGKRILKEVREETKSYADDLQQLVKQVVEWCSSHAKVLNKEMVEAQLEAIRLDSKKLTTVGKEIVDELRENVRERLLKAIEEPIRRKCNNFVRRSADVGMGVKNRVHELFDELLDDSLDAAVPAAQQILLDNYQELEREVRKVFTDHQDPIKTVVDTFLEKYQERENQAVQKQRRALLKDLEVVLAEAPSSNILALSQPEASN
jgi:GTP-binding protein EngB required for normal cell division